MKRTSRNITSNTFVKFLSRHRERVALIGVGLVFLLFVGGGIYIQKNKGKLENDQSPSSMPKSVKLNVGQKGAVDKQNSDTSQQSDAFFLRPSPDELLQQLASMENLNENVADAKFTGLKVLWPVYFFSSQDEGGGKATLLLDVSEDGFGVLIQSEVEMSAYPVLASLSAGQKVWVGGEILAVDPTGTGTIYLKTEHLKTGDELPSISTGIAPGKK